MPRVHHTAICSRDVDASLAFWRDGLGFEVLMDESFRGDWPTLFDAPTDRLRAVFLGDPHHPDAGIVELVDLGPDLRPPTEPPTEPPTDRPPAGVLLVSVLTDVDATLARLAALGLGGPPRRIEAHGIAMATVRAPDDVLVELVHDGAQANLDALRR